MLSLWCPHGTMQDLPRLLQTCSKLPLGPVSQGNVLLQSICDAFHRHHRGPSGHLAECAVTSVSFNISYVEVYWSSPKQRANCMHESGLVQTFKAVVVLHCAQAGLPDGVALRSRVEIQRAHEWVLGWDPSDSFCLQ